MTRSFDTVVLLPLYGTDSDCAPSLSGSLSPPSLGRVQGGLRDFSTRIGLVSRCCSLRHLLPTGQACCLLVRVVGLVLPLQASRALRAGLCVLVATHSNTTFTGLISPTGRLTLWPPRSARRLRMLYGACVAHTPRRLLIIVTKH